MITENNAAQQAIKKEYPNAIVINVANSSSPKKSSVVRRLQALNTQKFGGFNVKTKFATPDEIKAFTTRPNGSTQPVILFIMAENKKLTAEQKLRKIIREELLKEMTTEGKVLKNLNEEIADIKRRFLIEWKGTPNAQGNGEEFRMWDKVYRDFDALIVSLGNLSTKV